jgi:hypothetical protein
VIQVDPSELFLPSSRPDGPRQDKYFTQVGRYGSSIVGMPPLLLREGPSGYEILDGVTRASRIARLAPGTTVPAEVIDRATKAFKTKRISDILNRLPLPP